MRIKIAERLKPFSHAPGTSVILPGSSYLVQIFPCLFRIFQLDQAIPSLVSEFSLALKGPVDQFTVTQDLEKGRLTVSGFSSEGWLCYHLISSQDGKLIRFLVDRSPSAGLKISGQKDVRLKDKEWLDLFYSPILFESYQMSTCDRLSLGSHKAQEWDGIRRRLNLEEIFPLWHRLGQLVPQAKPPLLPEGTLLLLEECQRHFAFGKPEEAGKSWVKCFLGGFSNLFAPRLEDHDYQGLISSKPLVDLSISSLILLSEGTRLIRQLFMHQEKGKLFILPFLLPQLPSGRLIDVPLEGGGFVNIEWTKKTIRQVKLYSAQDGEIDLKFRSNVRSYRLREGIRGATERRSCSAPLPIKKGSTYFLDNFS